jgi:hypothetical protein
MHSIDGHGAIVLFRRAIVSRFGRITGSPPLPQLAKLAAGSLKLSFGLKPSRVLLSLHHFGTFRSQTVDAIL